MSPEQWEAVRQRKIKRYGAPQADHFEPTYKEDRQVNNMTVDYLRAFAASQKMKFNEPPMDEWGWYYWPKEKET